MSKKFSQLRFDFSNSSVNEKDIAKNILKLKPYIEEMQRIKDFSKPFCSINLPSEKILLKKTKEMIKEKLKLKPKLLVVIGIGGSNLGTMAVQEAILGKDYNLMNPKIKVIYLDAIDPDAFTRYKRLIEYFLSQKEKVLVNVISKSGTTTETIANFEAVLSLLKKYDKNYSNSIVITTDKGSKLWKYGLKEKYSLLEVPGNVGGRYSVLSAVGLFPLGILGVPIIQLLEGAKSMKERCLQVNEKNPAAVSASIQFYHYNKNKKISDLFLFASDLESLGKWNRQLIAESLGKKKKGITPTTSIGPIDLHSMAQLYLSGPSDKFTSFVRVKNFNEQVKVPINEDFSFIKEIQGKSFKRITDAILDGTKIAYQKAKKPFIEITLEQKDAYSIGQFLQFKMFETMFLAKLMNVNAFDQPDVEKYKIETRKLLKN